MTENVMLRARRRLRSVGRIFESDGPSSASSSPSSSKDDADARRMRSEFDAIRAHFPDHA